MGIRRDAAADRPPQRGQYDPSQSTCRTERRDRRSTALTVWCVRYACS